MAGTGFGPKNVPHLVSVYGQSFNLEIAPHFAFFRYADQPGMIGRVGTIFGEGGVNIASAAVGAEAGTEAVMAVTADKPVPQELVERDRRHRRLPRRPRRLALALTATKTTMSVSFEVDRFEWAADDQLEIEGRWFGLRGRRFIRPTLDVEVDGEPRRLLALHGAQAVAGARRRGLDCCVRLGGRARRRRRGTRRSLRI